MLKNRCFTRRIAFFLCLSLIVGLVPAGLFGDVMEVNAVSDALSNLVPNGDFERSDFLTHWAVYGGGTAAIESNVAGNKTHVMMLEDLSNKGYLEALGVKFKVEQGATYKFSMDIIQDAQVVDIANAQLATYVFWYDAEGEWIAPDGYDQDGNIIGEGYYTSIRSSAKADKWTTVTKEIVVPMGAVQAAIRLNFYVASINRVYVDNFSMVKIADGPFVPTESTEQTQATETTVATEATEETAVTQPKPTEATEVTSPVNPTQPPEPIELEQFPLNKDFENVNSNGRPSDWKCTIGNGGALEVVGSDVYSGEKSLKVAGGTGAIYLKSAFFSVTEGKYYTVTAMSKHVSGTKNAYIGLWFYDAGGKYIDAATVPIGASSQWAESLLSYAAPNGAATVLVEFGYHSKGESACLVDHITFTESDEKIEASPTVPERPTEPIDYNWSFEKVDINGKAINWKYDTNIFVTTADDAPDGIRVLQLEATGKAITAKSAKQLVEPGKTYKLKISAKELSGSTGIVGLYMTDANGKYTDGSQAVSTSGSGKWKVYTVLATATEDTVYMHVEAWVSSGNDVVFQIDAISVEETDEEIEKPWAPDPYDPPIIEGTDNQHPFMYFNEAELERIKSYKNDREKNVYGFNWRSEIDKLISIAERYLQEKKVTVGSNYGTKVTFQVAPTLKDPNDPSYDQMYIDASKDGKGNLVETPHLGFGASLTETMRGRMETLALAYCLTGDTRYSDLAVRYAVEMSQWKFWGDWDWLNGYTNGSSKADASNAWAMQGVVAVYDMCHDQLTDQQKQTIETAILERGLKPMSQQVSLTSIHNGNCMLIGGMLSGIAAILNEENADELKPYMDKALTALNNAFAQFAYSGNTEGHYYAGFGLEYLLPGAMHFYRATGLQEIVDHPLLSEMLPYWTVMFAAPGAMTHPNYSDGSVAVQLVFPMAVISKMTSDPLANYFLVSVGGVGSPFENLIYLNPEPEIRVPEGYATVVDPIGYGALRTGFASDDMLLTLLANDSQMGHNHYHQNAIQFNFGGDWLIADPGAGSYYYADRYFWTHTGHSTILVDGDAQSSLGTGSMEKVFDHSLYSYIVGSAPEAYGADDDINVLEKFDRHAIQLNHSENAYYIIIDDLLSEKEHIYSWQMFNGNRSNFEVDGKTVSKAGTALGNHVSMEVGIDVLNLDFVSKEKLSIVDQIYTANGKDAGKTLLANSAPAKAYQFMTVISVEGADGKDRSVTVAETYDSEEALGALINYAGDLYDLVMFNRTDALAAAGKLSTDGQQASVLGLDNGKITEGFAATKATTLLYDETVLFEAEKALNIVADAEGWHIDTAEVQTVKLSISTTEKLSAVTVNGEKVDAAAENGMITLTLAAGASDVAVEMEEHTHVPGEAVVDNLVEGDCVTNGSFDSVIYCEICQKELSRESEIIAALGHDLVHHEAKEPTNDSVGWNAYDSCTRCDYTTYVEIPALVAAGDFNGDGELTDADAIYLLYATFDEESYPLNQKADFNGDGEVTDADAIYLLYATFDPDGYPLK